MTHSFCIAGDFGIYFPYGVIFTDLFFKYLLHLCINLFFSHTLVDYHLFKECVWFGLVLSRKEMSTYLSPHIEAIIFIFYVNSGAYAASIKQIQMSYLIYSSSEFSTKLGESLRHSMLWYHKLWATPGVHILLEYDGR